jgi:hypothetical protein
LEKMVEEILRNKPENIVIVKIIQAWVYDIIHIKWLKIINKRSLVEEA